MIPFADCHKAQVTKVKWVKRDLVEGISGLEPAGREFSDSSELTEYVGRGALIYPHTLIPGKFHIRLEYEDFLYVPYNGSEHRVKGNVELLRFPPGSVSWLESKGPQAITITSNLIFGGVDPEQMEEVYVCRAWYTHPSRGRFLIPGKYFPSTGLCSICAYKVEYKHEEYEILSLNRYGISINAGNGRG